MAFREDVHADTEGGHPCASALPGWLCVGGAAEVQGKCQWELLPGDFCKTHVARPEQGWGSSVRQWGEQLQQQGAMLPPLP